MATDNSQRKQHAIAMFAQLPRRYDEVGAALSFFQDPRWRRAAVDAVAAEPDDRVLDVACGTGLVSRALVERWGCRVVGLDQSEPMLQRGREKLEAEPRLAPPVTFVAGEAEALPFADAEFDHLTFTYLLRYVDDPGATLRELARVVRPGGTVASLEFGLPSGLARPAWELYVRAGLPLAGRVLRNGWKEVGDFLGGSIRSYWDAYPEERQLELWDAAQIDDVALRRMSLGGGVVIWGRKT